MKKFVITLTIYHFSGPNGRGKTEGGIEMIFEWECVWATWSVATAIVTGSVKNCGKLISPFLVCDILWFSSELQRVWDFSGD